MKSPLIWNVVTYCEQKSPNQMKVALKLVMEHSTVHIFLKTDHVHDRVPLFLLQLTMQSVVNFGVAENGGVELV